MVATRDIVARSVVVPQARHRRAGAEVHTLCDEEIYFLRYNAPELKTIRHDRANGALYDDAVNDAVRSLCAAIAAQDTGTARQTLDLLYNSSNL